MDRDQIIALFVVGFAAAILTAGIIYKYHSYKNPKPFVAYGSMRNWYNQSPMFRLVRRVFGPIKEEWPIDSATAKPSATAAISDSLLFRRELADFSVNEINFDVAFNVVNFTLQLLGVTGTKLNNTRSTLRPGDLSELGTLAYQMRSSALFRPEGPQFAPGSLNQSEFPDPVQCHNLVLLLSHSAPYLLTCIKYSGFIKNAIEQARTLDPDWQNFIPSDTEIDAFVALCGEFYPERAYNA